MISDCLFTLALLVSPIRQLNNFWCEISALPSDRVCDYMVRKILLGVHSIQILVREMNAGWKFSLPSSMTNS